MVSIQFKSDQEQLTIKIFGNFDFLIHQQFKEIVNDHPDIKAIFIDLNETSYVDSSGIGMLLSLCEKIKDHRNNIIIKCGSMEIKQLFRSFQLHNMFTLR